MDWRLARGGVTADEVRRVAEGMEERFDEEQLQTATEGLSAGAALQIEEACLDHFLRESGISAVEWEKVRDRILLVHDRVDQPVPADLYVVKSSG